MKKVLASAIVMSLLLTGCSSKAPTQAQNLKPETPVFLLAGKVQASEAADLSAIFTGKVAAVNVAAGQFVKAGDPLIVYDNSEATAQTEITKEALETAKANYAKAKAGARPEQLLQAEAAVKTATLARDNAQKTLTRVTELFKNGAETANNLEAAQLQATSAESNYKNASEALAILKNGETKAYFDVLEKQVAQAQASVNSSMVTLANRTIKAPFDGYVTAVNAKVGETYTASTVLVSIENRERLNADTYGPATATQQFTVGEAVKIRVAEQPDKTFTGKVAFVGQAIDPKRRDVLVKVSLDPSKDVMTGMFIEVAPAK